MNSDLQAQNRELELKLSNLMYQRSMDAERAREAINRSSVSAQKRQINEQSHAYLDHTQNVS
jgi:hypothetical protein